MEGLQGEGGVADPGVAVVPVALAARGLGQRGGQRGDRRPGRHVGEALDRQRGALDRLPPAVVDHSRPRQPFAPEPRGRGDPSVGVIDAIRRGEALGPGERAVDLVALVQGVPRPHRVPLDPELHVRLQPDRLVGAAGIGGVAVLAHQRPLGLRRSRSRRRARRPAPSRRFHRGRERCAPGGGRRPRRAAGGYAG